MSQPFKNDDPDDFNLFVSPRAFSGRTPSAATVKTRVFQHPFHIQQALEAVASQDNNGDFNHASAPAPAPSDIEKPHADIVKPSPSTPRGYEEQATVRRRVSVVNWFAAICGFVVIVCGVWVAGEHFDAAVPPVIYNAASILGEPLYLGAALLVAGISMVCYGAVLGSGTLAVALASGSMRTRSQRLSLVLYEVLMFLTFVACSLTLFGAATALVRYGGDHAVPVAVWRNIPPLVRCDYERRNHCVGHLRGQCSSVKGNVALCAGLHCQKACVIHKDRGQCASCKSLIDDQNKFRHCVTHELKSNVDAGCGAHLLRKARIVLVVASIAAVLGNLATLVVAVVDILVAS